MEQNFKVYYVKAFPIDRITQKGYEGWHDMPDHTRHKYRFLDAILEHIDNTFCEPVQITMRSEADVSAGPSGVARMYALSNIRGWETIPAIVSTLTEPEWLDTSEPVTSLEQYRSYYRLEPVGIGFEENGRAYHRNQNPNPAQVMATMAVSDETKARLVAMLEEEAKR